MSRNKILTVCSLFIFFYACKKENSEIPPPEVLTTAQAKRVNVLKDVSTILLEVYKDPVALFEVNAAIYSEYYADETVLLKDLLYPEASKIYTSEKFKSIKAPKGVFRARFVEEFNKGTFPYLKEALGNASRDFSMIGLSAPGPALPDTAMEIFSNSSGVSIYFPYSENWGSYFTPTWFDNVNTDPFGVLATIVTADRDADSGPGQSARKTYVNNEPTIRYVAVTVDDVYADKFMTHIVNIGAELNLPQQPPPPAPSPGVNRVYIGEMRCNYYHDKLISMSGQNKGGGNDVQVMRISGYLQPINMQVTNYSGDIIPIKFKRRDVKKGIFRRTFSVWDADWISTNLEQVFVVYEDDDNITKTVTGGVTTTLTASPGNSIVATTNYSVTIPNADVIMRQLKISRNGYFTTAWSDQGWGYRPDKTFLQQSDPHGWGLYEGSPTGNLISWTWPYQVF